MFSSIGLILSFANITPEVRFEGKVTSVFIHPNYVPSVCLAGIFSTLALYHTVDKERIDKKLFFIISFIVQFAALAFSYTRDGMIAFLLGVTIFYFLSYRRKFIIALPFLIMLIPPALIAFIKLKGFVSFLSRFWLLIPAYYMFISDKTRMIWGYGAHNATMVYVQFKTMYNVMEDVNSPHNSYISYILMYGLLFVLLFIFLILKTIIKGFKKALKEKNHLPRVYWSLFISVVVAYLTVNLFESHLAMTFTTMMQPFLIFLGLLFFAIKNDDFSRGIKELTEKN